MAAEQLFRVKQYISAVASAGLGTVTLSSAFAADVLRAQDVATSGKTYSYLLIEGNNWEYGWSPVVNTAGVWTLTRTTCIRSSAGLATKVAFTTAALLTFTPNDEDFKSLQAAIDLGNVIPFMVAASDENTVITTGTAKLTFRSPFACDHVYLPRASLNVASSSGIPTFDINASGVSMLSTKLTIDATETTSVTAATPVVMSDTDWADNEEITIDFDVAGTGAKGVKILFFLRRK